ncbi:MAG TPA: RNA degradosome polyphosphate kinase [Ligilactobacillus saerimneri]|nr:RNA degradosome polyphosphate kinase [Ligilactobacillus saerimneri]
MKVKNKFLNPDFFINRELSWIDFNGRVLEEARDPENPLLERANFLGITQSNVDEFFMVRVASLNKLKTAHVEKKDAAGLTVAEQIEAINQKEHHMVARRYTTYNRSLIPLLAKQGIKIVSVRDLNDGQYEALRRYFNDEVYPVLTPMADDSSRPFPFIANNSLNIAVRLHLPTSTEAKYAIIRIPQLFKRLIRVVNEPNTFVLIEDIIKEFIPLLFAGYTIDETTTFRVIRDMDLDVAERDTSDLLLAVQEQLKEREHGSVVRLEIEKQTSSALARRLIINLKVSSQAIYYINGPIDLTFLKKLGREVNGHADLRFTPFTPYQVPELDEHHDIFAEIRRRDFLVQHPYDSFNSVINFIKQAAFDPQVLAIKMTLYRVSGNSPIIKYLGQAAQQGKQVTVLVEVKARFDEKNNVRWAKKLEEMGCHVIYGLVGLKTHSKTILIIRKEHDGIRRYMHFGTGNYNDVTAHFYTDIGLFTCNNEMGIDSTNLFNTLSGFSQPPYYHRLHLSPKNIRKFIGHKIDNEIAHAQAGDPALIRMKMNSLSDPHIIAKLYEAAVAGVKIELIVRGICCLRNDIPECKNNITVHSIVGRLLEHSRIYYFSNGGKEEIYFASADMMKRNLDRRVEILYPVLEDDLQQRGIAIFDILWRDNVKARNLVGTQFKRIDRRGITSFNAQEFFISEAKRKQRQIRKESKRRNKKASHFIPLLNDQN